MEEKDFLAELVGKILSENCQLNEEEYRALKENVSKQYNKDCPLTLEEIERRVKQNYYGTSINLLVNILSLVGDNNDKLEKICKKLEIED